MLFKKKKSVMLFAMPLAAICMEVLAQTNEPESSAGMVSPPKLIHEIDIAPDDSSTSYSSSFPLSISWSPDGTRMAVRSRVAVQIFDMTYPTTPRLLHTLNMNNKLKSLANLWSGAAYNDDGSQLWVEEGWPEYSFKIYSASNPTVLLESYTIIPRNDSMAEIAFSRSRNQLAFAGLGERVKVYEVEYPNPLQSHGASHTSSQPLYLTSLLHQLHHEEEWGSVAGMVFNHDGSRLAVGYDSGNVVTFNTSARSEKETSGTTFPLHALVATSELPEYRLSKKRRLDGYGWYTAEDYNPVASELAYNHDGSRLAVLDRHDTVNVYDGMNPVSPLYTLHGGGWSIAFNHDGSLLAVGDKNKVSIYQVDAAGSQPVSD